MKEDNKLYKRAFLMVIFTASIFASFVINGGANDVVKGGQILTNEGQARVSLKRYKNKKGFVFFLPHSNEETALYVVRRFLRSKGGTVYWVENDLKRNVSFKLEGVTYTFDPNRMFTDEGIRRTLSSQGSGAYSKKAHHFVKTFSQEVLKQIFAQELWRNTLVTVHNNTPGRYSILSYVEGGVYENEASAVYVNPKLDPDNFYFVTTKEVFDFIKSKRENVVLQSKFVSDDGSLSVYCAKNGIAYVNIEAQHGSSEIQREMVEILASIP